MVGDGLNEEVWFKLAGEILTHSSMSFPILLYKSLLLQLQIHPMIPWWIFVNVWVQPWLRQTAGKLEHCQPLTCVSSTKCHLNSNKPYIHFLKSVKSMQRERERKRLVLCMCTSTHNP